MNHRHKSIINEYLCHQKKYVWGPTCLCWGQGFSKFYRKGAYLHNNWGISGDLSAHPYDTGVSFSLITLIYYCKSTFACWQFQGVQLFSVWYGTLGTTSSLTMFVSIGDRIITWLSRYTPAQNCSSKYITNATQSSPPLNTMKTSSISSRGALRHM